MNVAPGNETDEPLTAGAACFRRGEYALAAKEYAAALEQRRESAVLTSLANTFRHLGNWSEMRCALQQAAELDGGPGVAESALSALSGDGAVLDASYDPRTTWFGERRGEKLSVEPDLVYDVGMNNGNDTAYYLHRGFRVVAIEADPSLCEAAAKRFSAALQAKRLSIVNIGIAAKPGTAEFWICDQKREWNSFNRTVAARDGLPHHSIEIPCQTFRWVVAHFGVPRFLKVDIEGNDWLCLEDLRHLAERPEYVSFEIGDINAFVAKLTSLGYRSFKCISQFNFSPLELPISGAERKVESEVDQPRRYIDGWHFMTGDSGPFGERTLGRWQSADEIIATHRIFLEKCRRGERSPFWYDKEYSFWVDIHARLAPPTEAAKP